VSFVIAPIVEGHGDVAAVPVLLRMVAPDLSIARPVRFARSRLVNRDHLVRAARIAAANIADRGAVLLIMDADEDCAAQLAPKLHAWLNETLTDRMCRVVLAVREFEAWIVGGQEEYHVPDPDGAGGLKKRIEARFGIYKETVDQPKHTAAIDLALLEVRSRSFRRFMKVVREFQSAAAA
jgi:hypothetical protein